MAFKKYPYCSAWNSPLVDGYNYFEPNLPSTAKNERFAYDEAIYTLDCALFAAFVSNDDVFIVAQWASESTVLEFKALTKQSGTWTTDEEKLKELKNAWSKKNEVAVLKVTKEQSSLYGLAKAVAESQVVVEANGLTFESRDNSNWEDIYNSALVYLIETLKNDGDTPPLRLFKSREEFTPLKNAGLRFDLSFSSGSLPIEKAEEDSLTWDSLSLTVSAFSKATEQTFKSGGSRYQSKALSPDERLDWLAANQNKLESLASQYNLKANPELVLKLGLSICGVNVIPTLPVGFTNHNNESKDSLLEQSPTFQAFSEAEKDEVRKALKGEDLSGVTIDALEKSLQALLADDFTNGEISWHKLPEML